MLSDKFRLANLNIFCRNEEPNNIKLITKWLVQYLFICYTLSSIEKLCQKSKIYREVTILFLVVLILFTLSAYSGLISFQFPESFSSKKNQTLFISLLACANLKHTIKNPKQLIPYIHPSVSN